jgi:hypothetical protein
VPRASDRHEGEHCFAGFEWGPLNPASDQFPAHPKGDVWASQQIATFGDFSVDEQPTVAIEYGAHSIEIRVEDLLSLRKAIDGLLEVFGVEVIA